MEQEINEKFLKLSTKVPISSDVVLGQDIVVTILGNAYMFNVVKEETNDMQDGTVNKTFVAKCLLE